MKRVTSPAGGPRGRFKGSASRPTTGESKSRPRTRDGPPDWDDDGEGSDPGYDGGVLVRLAVIPPDTRRNESRANQPFDLAKGREPYVRSPKATSRGVGHLLRPLPASEEVEAAARAMAQGEAWATTFLREDAGCPPAKFVYSAEARVRKWNLLRHLHGVIYGSGVWTHDAAWREPPYPPRLAANSGQRGRLSCTSLIFSILTVRAPRRLSQSLSLSSLRRPHEAGRLPAPQEGHLRADQGGAGIHGQGRGRRR